MVFPVAFGTDDAPAVTPETAATGQSAATDEKVAKAAEKLCEIIKSKTDKKVSIADLSRTDLAEDIEDAFRFSRMVVIAPSYDGGVFPIMNDFLHHLKIKGYKNRKVAMVENGSWAPSAAKTMRTYLEEMKNEMRRPMMLLISARNKKS